MSGHISKLRVLPDVVVTAGGRKVCEGETVWREHSFKLVLRLQAVVEVVTEDSQLVV